MLEKPKLFLNYKEFLSALLVFIIILSIRLAFLYGEYKSFIYKPFYFTTVKVLQQYKKEKNKKSYTVIRVYSKDLDLNFFTTIYRDINLIDKNIRLKLFPSKNISFIDYLTSSYIKSNLNRVKKSSKDIKSTLLNKIASQHKSETVSEFYQAIFLAKSISRSLRESVSKLGVSHLIALSGFHLAIVWGILFFILNPIYKLFQQKYFPYRFNLIDIGLIILVILAFFVWGVGSPASLVRSYVMMALGWLLLVLGMELISFSFLITSIAIIVTIFPKMLLSLSFWFSIAGVFYIFLLLERFNYRNKIVMTLIISFGIFILMLPIVHIIFPITNISQLYSPLLSLAFTIFYPLTIFLHIINFGWFFDSLLINLFTIDSNSINIKLPLIYGIIYIILSIGAIYSKWLFYLLFLVAIFFIFSNIIV